MKALVVMPANLEALELCEGLSAQGLEVSHAPSGLYALTLFERERPDVVVSTDDIDDMTGRELLEILNQDGGDQIAFILVSAQAATNLPPNAIVVLPEGLVTEVLECAGIAEVENAPRAGWFEVNQPQIEAFGIDRPEIDSPGGLEMDVRPEITPSDQPGYPNTDLLESVLDDLHQAGSPAQPAERTAGQFKFENQGFIHLVRWLSQVTEFARVELRCGPLVGQIYFVHSALTHAEFGRQRGEDAIRNLFLAAADHHGGAFSLEPIDATTAANLPMSISRPITQVVLTWSA